MELPINSDPEKLSVSAFGGKKPWQYAVIGASVAMCAAFVLVFQKILGQTLCSVICMVIIVPPGYLGIFTKNGMDFFEYRRAKKALGAGTYVYNSPPYIKVPEVKTEKKGAAYIVKNIITGGKYL